MAASLWPFWYLSSHITEGRGWLERSLARAGETSPAYRARAAVGLSQLSLFQGDFDRAVPLAEESLAYYRSTQDAAGIALTLDLLGRVAENTGNDVEAAAIYAEILDQYRTIGDDHHLVMALVNLADTAYRLGDFDGSEVLTNEAVALTNAIGNQHTQAWPLANAAQLALVRGDRDRARALNEEALALHIALGNRIGVADSLAGLAAVAASLGHHEIAASWLGSADALCETVGVPLLPHHGQYDRTVAAVRSALGDAKYRAAHESGRLRPIDDAIAEAQTLLTDRPPTPHPSPRDTTSALGLTPRELDVLQLVAKGLTDKEIGEALFISWRTAQGHVASILGKLDVSTRAAAAGVAFRDGLISEAEQPAG